MNRLSLLRALVRPLVPNLTGAGLVIVDQAVLSVVSVALTLALVYWGTKAELGIYALVNAGLLLGLGVQNAVVITPLVVNGAQYQGSDREALRWQMARLQLPLAVIAGAIGGLIAAALLGTNGVWSPLLGISVFCAVVGGWLREFRRGEQLLEQRYVSLLLGDALWASLAAGGLATFVALHRAIPAAVPMLCVGVAGMITGMPPLLAGVSRGTSRISPLRFGELVSQVRWTLPGMLVTWIQGAAYPYFVAVSAGSSAIAETAAARLFISPGLLVNGAIARYSLTHLGIAYRQAGVGGLLRRANAGVRLSVAAAAVYSLGVVLMLASGAVGLLPDEYDGIHLAIGAWVVVLGVTFVRTIPGNALHAALRFRSLFFAGSVSAALGSLASVVMGFALGGVGCILGIAVGEGCLCFLLWRELARGKSQAMARVERRIDA